jgi:hypothetical protein
VSIASILQETFKRILTASSHSMAIRAQTNSTVPLRLCPSCPPAPSTGRSTAFRPYRHQPSHTPDFSQPPRSSQTPQYSACPPPLSAMSPPRIQTVSRHQNQISPSAWRTPASRPSQRTVLMLLQDDCRVLSEPHKAQIGLRFPFLVVESKGGAAGGRNMIWAQNQAAVDGACALNILGDLQGVVTRIVPRPDYGQDAQGNTNEEQGEGDKPPAVLFSVTTEDPPA